MKVKEFMKLHSSERVELICNEKGPDGSIGFIAWSTNQDLTANYGSMTVISWHTEIKYSGSYLAPKQQTWIVATVVY